MNYVSSCGLPLQQTQISHRDLAARNILVNCVADRVLVKISDFGLARQLSGTDDIYHTDQAVRNELLHI